ncbi:MAG: acyl-CoA dehydrogenase [Niabella sp.]
MSLQPDLNTIYTLGRLSAAAEESETLLPEQLDIIYSNNWFRLFVPVSFGGIGADLADGLKLEETLAKIDGSLGWTVTLCSGACMFAGYMENDMAREIFADDKVCFAGSGQATGIAKVVDDGFLINGFWSYATGTPYATVFTVNCKIEKDGIILVNEKGEPETRSFFFKKEEVIIHYDWNTMGLKATAGHSFSVHNLHVKPNRSFIIDTAHATINEPIYSYPFLQFAEATLAVNTLGMTLHFLDECTTIFDNVKIAAAQKIIIKGKAAQAIENISRLKAAFYKIVTQSWQEQVADGKAKAASLQEVSAMSRKLVAEARNIVAALYPYCGISQTKSGSVINRILRDVFTASQHRLLSLPEACYST